MNDQRLPSAGPGCVLMAQLLPLALLWTTAGISLGQAPSITLQPTNFPTLSLGASVGNRVGAGGSSPLSYQWRHNGLPLPGRNATTITLANLTLADAGAYDVVVTNLSGAITSSVVSLQVDPTFTKITTGVLVSDALSDHAVAWGDYNGDGFPDVITSGGWWNSAAYMSNLYTNRQDGTFLKASPNPFTASANALCVNWADVDNDGDLDFWVGVNEAAAPQFFTNNGNSVFTRLLASSTWITNGNTLRGSAQAWADFDRDGLVDLVIVPRGEATASSGPISLLHNLGNGRFAVLTNNSLYQVRKFSSSVTWTDFDNDGDPDLVCASGSPATFRNDDGLFSYWAEGNNAFANANADAWADIDNDGQLEVLVLRWQKSPRLWRNNYPGPWILLDDAPYQALQNIESSTEGNGAAWGDYDNDGDLDLFVPTSGSNNTVNRNHLFRNDGPAGFVEVLAGSPVWEQARSHKCAWVDYNNDGYLDLHVVNGYNTVGVSQNNFLYRNNGNTNNWLKVRLSGQASNRSGIGAKLRVKANIQGKEVWQLRTITAQAFTQELEAHFGLGNAAQADLLRIEWPSGIRQDLLSVPANQILSVQEEVLAISSSVPASAPFVVEVPKGQSVTLTLSSVPPGVALQWQFNGMDIPRATNSSLVVEVLAADDLGRYSVVVTAPGYQVASRPLTVRMLGAPKIVSGPWLLTPHSVSVGAPIAMRATVEGTPAPACHWQCNGVDIPIASNPTAGTTELQIAAAALTNSGTYRLVLSNSVDVVISATLQVEVDPTFTKITTGPIVTDKAPFWGLTWGDLTGDGYLDLVATMDWGTVRPDHNRFFRNQQDGTFAADESGLLAKQTGHFGGSTTADFDNDGWLDLFIPDVTRWYYPANAANHVLFRGIGGGELARIVGDPLTGITMGWDTTSGDLNNDGFVDLVVIGAWNSVNTRNYLFLNNGTGGFTRVVTGPVVTDPANAEFSSASDFDNDGDLDLLLSCHSERLFYTNHGNGTFSRFLTGPIPTDSGNSAGIAWGDYDNDGRIDLCLATFDEELHLFHNQGAGGFTRTLLGATANYQIPVWTDYDNDGWLDLFVSHGPASWSSDLRSRMFHNNGDGTFTEVLIGSPTSEGGQSITCASADYDNNGFPDLVVANGYETNGGIFLYRNNGNSNHWLSVRTIGTHSNRSGIGAKVKALATVGGRTFWQQREITGGSSRNQGDPRATFGLGDATNVTTLRIEWPSGIVQELHNVEANKFITIVESQDYTGARPQISSAAKTTGGIELSLAEPAAGAHYILEASTNLVTWTKLLAKTSAGGTAQFTDTKASSHTKRFYRLQVP